MSFTGRCTWLIETIVMVVIDPPQANKAKTVAENLDGLHSVARAEPLDVFREQPYVFQTPARSVQLLKNNLHVEVPVIPADEERAIAKETFARSSEAG